MMATQDSTRFYQKHLERVSRSFAFCIEELDQPLRHWIGLAYILCRIVDTVEDAQWSDAENQQRAFDAFLEQLTDPRKIISEEEWAERFPANIPEGEKVLLREAPRFFTDLHALDEAPKKILQKSISEMARGMNFFCRHKTVDGNLQLNSLTETNQYCFFVAGLVGELLTGVASIAIQNFDDSKENLLNAFHFGLYLQKINLLKDQLTDEAEGRFFVGCRADLKSSLLTNARHSLEYILKLPVEAKPYRIFCAWSFFLGLASLPWIDKSWENKKNLKISRVETWSLLKDVKSHISDNEYLIKKYHDLTQSQRKTHWYQEIYQGPLSPTDFEHLGMA